MKSAKLHVVHAGLEVDLIASNGNTVTLIEAKSGATIAGDFMDAVDHVLASDRGAST